MTHVLAIDQGTTSSRALVVDGAGRIAGLGQVPFAQHFPRPGWVEHEPEAIWESTLEAIRRALKAASVLSREIAAIGITNQRETVVAWERATGAPLGNAIVWQDRRSAGICEELRRQGLEATVQEKAGLTLDPYFSGTKLTWLLRQYPAIRARAERGEVVAGTVDSWLLWKLTGGRRFATDFTNASRTMLFDFHQQDWDEELCGRLEVPRAMLAEVAPSTADYGATDEAVLGARIPVLAMAGDQQSALYGQACFRPGLAKNTYGTGCFLLVNRGNDSRPSMHRMLTSLSAGATASVPEYALEGSVFVAGSLVQWLRDGMGIIERSDQIETLAGEVEDSAGVTIVPAFAGLGAPHWDAEARGAILGLTRGTTRAHIARAALEAIAFSSVDVAHSMAEDLGGPLVELRVDGGAAANNLLMQMQADLAGIPVTRPRETETTALGAAYLAGVAAGVWAGEDEISALWRPERTFEPRIGAVEREERLRAWRKAVGRVLERGRD